LRTEPKKQLILETNVSTWEIKWHAVDDVAQPDREGKVYGETREKQDVFNYRAYLGRT